MSGLKSRCRNRRSRAIALAGGSVLAAMLVAVPVASGSPWPNPLVHAPRFARAFGQRALAQPGGVAVDAARHVWAPASDRAPADGMKPGIQRVLTH